MAQNQPLHLHEDFDAPMVRAKLDILLLLAEAVRPSLKDLRQALPEGWHEVVTTLAKTLADELKFVTATSDVGPIWKQFQANARITKLGKVPAAILRSVSPRLSSGRRSKDQSLKYLVEENKHAIAWIKAVGALRKISAFQNASRVPVRVYYDPDADEYCASSSPTAGEIGWKLQLKEHAFYGALIPDMLFEHEYISHLLPLNRFLSRSVREIWLTLALIREHKNASIDADQKHVNLFLWEKFRHELARHFDSDIELYGPLHLDSMAWNVSFHAPEAFWRITAEIMHFEDESAKADVIDDLLKMLAGLDDSKLREVLALKWENLDGLHAVIHKVISA